MTQIVPREDLKFRIQSQFADFKFQTGGKKGVIYPKHLRDCVAEAFRQGHSISSIARWANVSPTLIWQWKDKRQASKKSPLKKSPPPRLQKLHIVPSPQTSEPFHLKIQFPSGASLEVSDPGFLKSPEMAALLFAKIGSAQC